MLCACSWAWTGWFSNGEGQWGLLWTPDHIQELWHSEAIREVISYWAMGLLYVWAKLLIYSGKRFYHHPAAGSIHHRKQHTVTLCNNLQRILCPEYSAHLFLHLIKDAPGWEKGHEDYRAMGLLMLEGWLQLNLEKWLPKRLDRYLWNHVRCGESG